MKLVVVGLGQCGGRLADEFARMSKNIITGAFAVNTDEADLTGLKKIPSDYQHRILLGGRKTSGHGVGKVNEAGAQLAREGGDKIIDALRVTPRFYETDAFLVIGSTAGGTGSGGLPVLTEMIKQRYRHKPVYALAVLPFEHEENAELRSVQNTATCLKSVFAVADAVFADLLAQPHDEGGPRRERDHAHQREANARIRHDRRTPRLQALEIDRNADGLDDTQADRAVARILRDLLLTFRPFLGQLLKRRDDGREQRHDDRGANVRHDAQRKHRRIAERAPAEHVIEAQQAAAHALNGRGEFPPVHAGRRHVGAEPIDGQHRQREPNPAFQLRNLERVPEGFDGLRHLSLLPGRRSCARGLGLTWPRNQFHGTADGLDLGAGARRNGMDRKAEFLPQLAAAQHLDATGGGVGQTGLDDGLGRDLGAVVKHAV